MSYVRMSVAPAMFCPHCRTKGAVFTGKTKVKREISRGKATGAPLAGGLSILAPALSRKQRATSVECKNCGAQWIDVLDGDQGLRSRLSAAKVRVGLVLGPRQ